MEGCEGYEGAHEVSFMEATHRWEEGDSLCRREGPAPPPILIESPENLHFSLEFEVNRIERLVKFWHGLIYDTLYSNRRPGL